MANLFPGIKMFFIVWGIIFAVNIVLTLVGSPLIVMAVGGGLFWLWVLWAVIGAVVRRRGG